MKVPGALKTRILALSITGMYLSNPDGTVARVAVYDEVCKVRAYQKFLILDLVDDASVMLCLSPFPDVNSSSDPSRVIREIEKRCKHLRIERAPSLAALTGSPLNRTRRDDGDGGGNGADENEFSSPSRASVEASPSSIQFGTSTVSSSPSLTGAVMNNSTLFFTEDERDIMANAKPDEWRRVITTLYQKYNPEKCSDVPRLLETFAGKEDQLLLGIVKKYGGTLEDATRLLLPVVSSNRNINATTTTVEHDTSQSSRAAPEALWGAKPSTSFESFGGNRTITTSQQQPQQVSAGRGGGGGMKAYADTYEGSMPSVGESFLQSLRSGRSDHQTEDHADDDDDVWGAHHDGDNTGEDDQNRYGSDTPVVYEWNQSNDHDLNQHWSPEYIEARIAEAAVDRILEEEGEGKEEDHIDEDAYNDDRGRRGVEASNIDKYEYGDGPLRGQVDETEYRDDYVDDDDNNVEVFDAVTNDRYYSAPAGDLLLPSPVPVVDHAWSQYARSPSEMAGLQARPRIHISSLEGQLANLYHHTEEPTFEDYDKIPYSAAMVHSDADGEEQQYPQQQHQQQQQVNDDEDKEEDIYQRAEFIRDYHPSFAAKNVPEVTKPFETRSRSPTERLSLENNPSPSSVRGSSLLSSYQTTAATAAAAAPSSSSSSHYRVAAKYATGRGLFGGRSTTTAAPQQQQQQQHHQPSSSRETSRESLQPGDDHETAIPPSWEELESVAARQSTQSTRQRNDDDGDDGDRWGAVDMYQVNFSPPPQQGKSRRQHQQQPERSPSLSMSSSSPPARRQSSPRTSRDAEEEERFAAEEPISRQSSLPSPLPPSTTITAKSLSPEQHRIHLQRQQHLRPPPRPQFHEDEYASSSGGVSALTGHERSLWNGSLSSLTPTDMAYDGFSRYFIAANATERHQALQPLNASLPSHVNPRSIYLDELVRLCLRVVVPEYHDHHRRSGPNNTVAAGDRFSTVYLQWSDDVQARFFFSLEEWMSDEQQLQKFLEAVAPTVGSSFESLSLTLRLPPSRRGGVMIAAGTRNLHCPRLLFEAFVVAWSSRHRFILTITSRFGNYTLDNASTKFLEFLDKCNERLAVIDEVSTTSTSHDRRTTIRSSGSSGVAVNPKRRVVEKLTPSAVGSKWHRELRRRQMQRDADNHSNSLVPSRGGGGSGYDADSDFSELWAQGNVLLRVQSLPYCPGGDAGNGSSGGEVVGVCSIPLNEWNDTVAKWNSLYGPALTSANR